jgi:hypothetical protein
MIEKFQLTKFVILCFLLQIHLMRKHVVADQPQTRPFFHRNQNNHQRPGSQYFSRKGKLFPIDI